MEPNEKDLHRSNDAANDAKQANNNALINRIARESGTGNPGKLLSFQNAPDNTLVRYGMVTINGLENVPKGVYHSISRNISHPMEALETAGTAAGMALVLKTVLPEGGIAGKVAGAAIGAYFTYKAAEPIIDSYKIAHNARSMSQMDYASRQFGDAGGSFLVNSAIAAAGYKLGSHITDRVLTSQSMDGFSDAKANFYSRLGDAGKRLTDNLGITVPDQSGRFTFKSSDGLSSRVRLGASERTAPTGELKGAVDPAVEMDVTVMLKSKGTDLRMERTLARIAQGRQAPLNDTQFAEQFSARPESLKAVTQFAESNGLKVTESDLRSGRVVLHGKVGDFSNAFETRLAQYEKSGSVFRGREGSLSVPSEIANHIEGVLGMDNRPQARSYVISRMLESETSIDPRKLLESKAPADSPSPAPAPTEPSPTGPNARRGGYMPNEVADAYNFPKNTTGEGQSVAVIELGGGLDLAENSKYYKQNNLPEPNVKIIEMNGAKNSPGNDSRADAEVHLDSQIIGVVAPKAEQKLIFTENSDKGFIDAITRATFPEAGEKPNSAISISWGAPEEAWSKQGLDGLSTALKKAALKGLSVFAASGDDGALDNSRSSTFQVDFPASEPTVTGTGGTKLTLKDGVVDSEVAWNSGRNSAGGGGVSQQFPIPEYQNGLSIPANANRGGGVGRGVPDVAGNADPATGYRIRLPGGESVSGGTSAVAPLYAGLTMRLNEALGKPIGSLNPWLYKNTGIFNDIVQGNNGGYKTGPGWDAVTGWGSIDGTKMLETLKTNPNVSPSFGQFTFVGPSQIGFAAPTDQSRK